MYLKNLLILLLICCIWQEVELSNTTTISKVTIAKVSTDTMNLVASGVQLVVNSKILATVSEILGPVGLALGVTKSIMELFSQPPDISDLFKEQTKFINESFIAMSMQLKHLSDQLSQSENKIIATVQYQAILHKTSRIDSFLDRLPILISSFQKKPEELRMKIEQQTKKFNEIDDDLAQLLLVDAPETSQQSSLIGSIISLCSPNKQDCESMSSTNQVIYQFFIHVLIYVSKGGTFLQKCYEMIEKLSDEDHQESIHYVKSKTQASMLNIMEALEKALKRYSEPIHLKSHLKLLNSFEEDVDFVRMQRVAYNVILAEDSFGRCDMDCPYYDYSKINRTECRGSVYECAPSAALSNHVYEVFSKDPSTVYKAYYTWGAWNGMNVGDDWQNPLLTYLSGFAKCDVCQCICDSYNEAESHRSIYAGIMEPKYPNFVITGVKFTKKNKIIFLQIQIGKLLPLGMIDASTVEWQELPQKVNNSQTVRMGYRTNALLLPVFSLPKGYVLTGFKFLEFETGEVSMSITGNAFDFKSGELKNETKVMDGIPKPDITTIKMNGRIQLLDSKKYPEYNITENSKIIMGKSSEKHNAGQHFLPYFDSQNISLIIPAPLSGLELIYYTAPFDSDNIYGGFVRPRISTLNYLDYL